MGDEDVSELVKEAKVRYAWLGILLGLASPSGRSLFYLYLGTRGTRGLSLFLLFLLCGSPGLSSDRWIGKQRQIFVLIKCSKFLGLRQTYKKRKKLTICKLKVGL